MEIYCLSKTIYLDKISKEYRNIVTIDRKPNGILNTRIKTMQNNQLSPFKTSNTYCYNNCILAILNENKELLCLEELPNFISFLLANNYKIDYNLSKLLKSNNINTNPNSSIIFYITNEN